MKDCSKCIRVWSAGVGVAVAGLLAFGGTVYGGSGDGLEVWLQPVEAHSKPGDINSPSVGTITPEGDEIILEKGGANVWLEIRIGNWDPDGLGVQFAGWDAFLDTSGFTSGLEGTLTLKSPECDGTQPDFGHADCEQALGPGTTIEPCTWPPCFCRLPLRWPPVTPTNCSPAFINVDRNDFITPGGLLAVNPVELRFGSVWFEGHSPPGTCSISGEVCRADIDCFIKSLDPADVCTGPFPAGGLYGGTLVIEVPDDAKGTFEIDLTDLVFVQPYPYEPIPLSAVTPAKITVQTGRCCFDPTSEDPACVDDVTWNECDALPGPREFTPGGVCADGCPTAEPCCLSDRSCEMLLPHQCAAEGGQVVDECLGDGDGDGFDDACPSGGIPAVDEIPTVSAWGLVIMALLLAVLGKAYFRRRGDVGSDLRDCPRPTDYK